MANGEIYNYQELAVSLGFSDEMRTGSDCEALLYLYRAHGVDLLKPARAMVALGLIDEARGTLHLGRDRFGIKPVYYALVDGGVVFGSEIKALAAHPEVQIDFDPMAALGDDGLLLRGPSTLDPLPYFDGVHMVPPGHVVSFDLASGRRIGSHAYWDLPSTREEARDLSGCSVDELRETYASLLRSSVADCLNAKSELGLFLSGGIDSGAVGKIAMDLGRPLPCYTAVSPGTLANGDCLTAYAHGREFTEEHELVTVPPPLSRDEWVGHLRSVESPIASVESFYKWSLFRAVRARHPQIRGMLSGAACDEFHGGYSSTWAPGMGWPGFLSQIVRFLDGGFVRNVSSLNPVAGRWGDFFADPEDGGRASYGRYLSYEKNKLARYNLHHEDRNAAAFGFEGRVPFLDHRVVEFMAALRWRSDWDALLWDKGLLRETLSHEFGIAWSQEAKVPFFYGAGQRLDTSGFVRLLSDSDMTIVHEACDNLPDLLNREKLVAKVAAMRAGVGIDAVEQVLAIVNVGLLAGMRFDPAGEAPGGHGGFASVEVIEPDGLRRRSEEVVDDDRRGILVRNRHPYRLSPGVEVLQCPDNGRWPSPGLVVLRNGVAETLVDDPDLVGLLLTASGAGADGAGLLGGSGEVSESRLDDAVVRLVSAGMVAGTPGDVEEGEM